MFIQQIYTSCLSEASYYIEHEGQVAIVDPLRDYQQYIHLAKERNATIVFILETHFHADFVSGHLDLAKHTNAKIVYGPQAETSYPVYVAKHGEKISLGNTYIEVLSTPGHTLESCCYLLYNEQQMPYCLFSGDTVFVGEVGRPDLCQTTDHLSSDYLAGLLYDSIHKIILPLHDDIILYPAHGQGSACGKNISSERFSTLGIQKKLNYALQDMPKASFIKILLEGLPTPPAYYPINRNINRQGYISIDQLLKKVIPLSLADFKINMQKKEVLIIDTRAIESFCNSFIPQSIFIGLSGRFAEWAGSLLPFNKSILLVTEKDKAEESIIRLARVGFENIIGYLEGGFDTWKDAQEPIDMIIQIEPDELSMDIPNDLHLHLIDVRKKSEFDVAHIEEAENIPVEKFIDPKTFSIFNEKNNIYLYCLSGYRSTITSSLIKKEGFHNIRVIKDGWNGIEKIKNKFNIVSCLVSQRC